MALESLCGARLAGWRVRVLVHDPLTHCSLRSQKSRISVVQAGIYTERRVRPRESLCPMDRLKPVYASWIRLGREKNIIKKQNKIKGNRIVGKANTESNWLLHNKAHGL